MANTVLSAPIRGRAMRAPEYNGPADLPRPGVDQTARLDDSAARIALQGAGNEWGAMAKAMDNIRQADEAIFKVYDSYQTYKARQAFNEYQNEAMLRQAEWNTLEGEHALEKDGVRDRMEQWQQEAKERLAGKLSPYARKMFDRQAADTDAKLGHWAIGKIDRELKVFQDSVDAGTVLNAENIAIQNPDRIPEAMGMQKFALENKAKREGKDTEHARQTVIKAERQLLAKVADKLLDAYDLNGFDRLLAQYGGKIDPADRFRFNEKRAEVVLDQSKDLAAKGDWDGARRRVMENTSGQAFGETIYERTREMMRRGVRYGFGSRGLDSGKIDCSGFVGGTQAEAMEAANKQAGKEIFTQAQIDRMRNGTSESIIDQVSRQSGMLLTNQQITAASLQPGMMIGLDTGNKGFDKGRARGIDHIAQVVVDPETGRKMIAESQSKAGVTMTPVDEWLASNQKHKLYATGFSNTAWGSPNINAKYRKFLGDLDKQEKLDLTSAVIAEVMQQTDGLAGDARESKAIEIIRQRTSDPALQEKIFDGVEKQSKIRDREKIVADNEAVRKFEAEALNGNWSWARILQELSRSGMSAEARDKVIENANKSREKPNQEKRAYADQLYIEIDKGIKAGKPMTRGEIEEYAAKNSLTTAQTVAALQYSKDGGKLKGLNYNTVQSIYRMIVDKTDAKLPDGMWEKLQTQIPDGKTPTSLELEQWVRNLAWEGENLAENGWWTTWGYGRDETYLDAVKAGRGDTWMPTLKPEERELYLDELNKINQQIMRDNAAGKPHQDPIPLDDYSLANYARMAKGLPDLSVPKNAKRPKLAVKGD